MGCFYFVLPLTPPLNFSRKNPSSEQLEGFMYCRRRLQSPLRLIEKLLYPSANLYGWKGEVMQDGNLFPRVLS
jgi:hypothetical protein